MSLASLFEDLRFIFETLTVDLLIQKTLWVKNNGF